MPHPLSHYPPESQTMSPLPSMRTKPCVQDKISVHEQFLIKLCLVVPCLQPGPELTDPYHKQKYNSGNKNKFNPFFVFHPEGKVIKAALWVSCWSQHNKEMISSRVPATRKGGDLLSDELKKSQVILRKAISAVSDYT